MAQALKINASGARVEALQEALNARAEPRFYPPIALDGELGPATVQAYLALGFAMGLPEKELDPTVVSPAVVKLLTEPSARDEQQVARARQRAGKLHERTVAMDGTPTYWGLAKPLVRAREHGWSGRLSSSDRRKGVAEQFGKKSQATLFDCFSGRQQLGRCPGTCGGDCNPANPPGASSHEQCSDAAAFPGPKGRKLSWWELGLDVTESEQAMQILTRLGYGIRRPYSSPSEAHHLNFTSHPGPVLPPAGPNARPDKVPVKTPRAPAPKAKAAARVKGKGFTGVDVSQNQPEINWKQVKAAGHTFAFVKVSDGLGTPDPSFGKARWAEMKKAGLIRGAYHFGRPQKGRDPRDEVHEFLQHLQAAGGLAPGDLVPVLDLEKHGAAGALTARQTLEWARGWVSEMHAQIGRRPIIYTGVFWRETMGNPADSLGCPLWLAAYVAASTAGQLTPAAWKDHGFTLWQHTESGSCDGIPGHCDLNRFPADGAALVKLLMH